MNDKIGISITSCVLAFCIGLFLYLAICGFKRIQPFTHNTEVIQENNLCGELKQIKGYCCNSQEQFESGDCTK